MRFASLGLCGVLRLEPCEGGGSAPRTCLSVCLVRLSGSFVCFSVRPGFLFFRRLVLLPFVRVFGIVLNMYRVFRDHVSCQFSLTSPVSSRPFPPLPFSPPVGSRTLTNRAVYKGWSGFTTTVQLDAVIEPLQDQANRLAVGFHKAIVNVAGMKVTFPHLQRFRYSTYVSNRLVLLPHRCIAGSLA